MVDYAPPWDALPRDSLHAAHEMPLSQVRNLAVYYPILPPSTALLAAQRLSAHFAHFGSTPFR